MGNVLTTMTDNYIFAVIRGKTEEDGFNIAKASVEGGIKNLELTIKSTGIQRITI